jgi:hypothetical protein
MEALPDVSRSDLKALAKLQKLIEGRGQVALDPRQAVHREAIAASLRASGRDPERYPALHAALNAPASAGGGRESSLLVDSGTDRGRRATAQVWHTADGAPLFMGSALFALHPNRPSLVAYGQNTSLTGFLATSTDTATAQPAPRRFRLLDIGHATHLDGTTRFTALSSAAESSPQADVQANVTISEPVITVTGNTVVVIALGRDSGHTNPDADYTYVEPTNVGTPFLIVPFVGQAVMPYQITGTPGQPVAGAQLSTKLYFVKSDGTVLTIALNGTYTTATRLANGVTINVGDALLLEFSYPADGNSYQNTSSLVYNQQSLTNEQVSYFFYQFQIPVTGAPVSTYSFAVCSQNTPNQPSIQCVEINNLMFWWHCLAEGTRIRMHDGSDAAIETLDNTRRVRTAEGGELAVEATSKGPHVGSAASPGPGAVYRLCTESGHVLVATGSHPVVTPVGLIAIADLNPRHQVLVENGVSRVKSVEAIDHEGSFFNLKLGDQVDRAAAGGAVLGTYLANGIAVGDHAAMQVHADRRRKDLDFMLPRLPEGQRRDYASAVQDVRY